MGIHVWAVASPTFGQLEPASFTFGQSPEASPTFGQTRAQRLHSHSSRGLTQSNGKVHVEVIPLPLLIAEGMVLPKCWIGLAWVVAFYGCLAQTQALLSEDELIRALMAAREAEDSGYVRGALPVMEKRRQQAFSAWAGKRSGEMPIYNEVPEYASSGHMRRKRSSGESFEDFEESNQDLEKRSSGGSNRFARDIREPAVGRPVKGPESDVVFRPQRATFSAWGGR